MKKGDLISRSELLKEFDPNGERLDPILVRSRIVQANGMSEQEIRSKAIEEFAERLKERVAGMQMAELQGEDVCPCAETGEDCPDMNQDIGCQYCAREQTIKDINEIAEQLKGGE